MSQLVNGIILSSLYILCAGVLFLGARKTLNLLNCPQVLIYRLWIIFPIGLITMLLLFSIDFDTNLPLQVSTLQLSTIITTTYQSSKPESSFSWVYMLMFVWILSAVFNLLKLVYTYLKFKKKLVSSSFENQNGIFHSHEISGPLAFGFIKSNVYFPSHFKLDETNQLLIKHERVHCERKDPFMRIVYKTLVSIFWFHPMIYILNKFMIRDQETSCDELVLVHENDGITYSKLLLDLTITNNKLNELPGHFCSSSTMLKERIMLIKKLKVNQNKSIGYSILVLTLFGLVITSTTLAGMVKENTETKQTIKAVLIAPESSKTPEPLEFPEVPKSPVKHVAILSSSESPVAVSKPPKASEKYVAELEKPKTSILTEAKELPQTPPKIPKPIKINTDEGTEIKILKTAAPSYPYRAAKKRISGFVNLELTLDTKGKIENVKVIESMPEGVFDKEAIKAIKKYEFAPLSKRVTMQHKISFEIANKTGYGVVK